MRATVPAGLGGDRLDVACAEMLDLSRSAAARLIDDGRVVVDGRKRARSFRVAPGQVLEVSEPEPVQTPAPVLPPIRYDDDDLLVVAKPAGLVVHPGAGHPAGTLVDALQAADIPLAPRGGEGRPGIVHRLDRDTSGLLVVAKTDAAHEGLVGALKHRAVHREYRALVEGRLPAVSGKVEAPIGRHPTRRTMFAVTADGRRAVTHWRVQADGELQQSPVQLIACRLETGRTHQIRVHLSYARSPVVGDDVYGARQDLAAAAGLGRFFLHAMRLAFTHPITGDEVVVTEPLPDDLVAALGRAGIDPGAAATAEW